MPPKRATRGQKRSIEEAGDEGKAPVASKSNSRQVPTATAEAEASGSGSAAATILGPPRVARGPKGEAFIPRLFPKAVAKAAQKLPIPQGWVNGIDGTDDSSMTLGDRVWWAESDDWLLKNKKALKFKEADWKRKDEAMAKETPRKADEGYDDFDFVCVHTPAKDEDDEDEAEEDEEDEEDEEEDEDEVEKAAKGSRGEEFVGKLASLHPDRVWVFSMLGQDRFQWWLLESLKRDQDEFMMHIYSHFSHYGKFEVMENLFLHFNSKNTAKAKASVLWPELEGLALLLNYDIIDFFMSDDSDKAHATIEMVGHLVISVLNSLKKEGLLTANSSIPNIGLVLAIFVKWVSTLHSICSWDDSTSWVHVVLEMAEDAQIKLSGPPGYASSLKRVQEQVDESNDDEMWKGSFKDAMKTFEGDHASSASARAKPKLGGTHYDITKMSAAERKESSYNQGF
ncbi:hypothetical protein B0J13DRAFT_550160 [Dactylonectria estremocensis]|uniref:Uncharacterized protein n=1 Tax=Dactylonectria estremocensis TaxID=1079267 RepID=A0A9P9F390_9HYPO|nr:hypothetical protein B0J13DRAFT_550160 [Dactylonectria estremocensis]